MNRPLPMNRRRLLKLGGAALLSATITGRLYAAPSAGPRFLLVFLRGGYDSTNLLIPYSSSFYYEARPTIAIGKPDPSSNSSALALDGDWALAPAVRDTIGTMYLQRQVAFVPFAGTDDLSRSHFETQDSIELGQPAAGKRNYRSGFLGRLSEILVGSSGTNASIAFTDALPLAFEGSAAVPNLSLKNVGKPPFDERQGRILSDMYAGHRLEAAVGNGLELRHEVAQEMADEMTAANRNAINTKGFELEAERMGRLMRDKYRLGFIDIGGWDTHVGEGAAQGALATNLGSLGKGLQAFSQSLGAEWNNTVVVVVSEFGRTFRENGNRGTDHGHGTVYWVLGGSISGGRICGEQQPVRQATLFQNRDFPVLNDYRSVLGGLFRSLWDLSPAQSAGIFPQAASIDLKLVS
ncbi:MAG TPA: DUF1501 domain-containing protein [Steroidobacteraceae bacterium]|nr:DUF1501 domain-containing protein [Steroidobacteraceae bacterium]